MKKIYFRNGEKWENIKAFLYNCDESLEQCVELITFDADGDYAIDFDDEVFDHLYFMNDSGDMTTKVYPGHMSIGIEYKMNKRMGRCLTYLFTKVNGKTGRVENHIIRDSSNLSYRKGKSKKVRVFIPKSYDGKTPHDILYFFDAQNLFCNAGRYTRYGDPYGSWQLDNVLSEIYRQLGENIIVVGIDNADMYRSNELFMNPEKFGDLSPLATAIPDDDFSKGYLERLSSFMVTTLHDFIKERYCVKSDNIGIGGASMGGIASFFCGLYEMGFYKYVLSYSPAFGLYEMSAFDNWFKSIDFKKYSDKLPKIHIYCGGGDDLEKSLLPSSMAMKKLMISHGYESSKVFESYDMEKPHNEESWRLVLPQSFSYLLK